MESFIVRVWVPSDSSEQEQLRGVVEHVGSGSETTFVDEDELLATLRASVREREPTQTPAGKSGGAS